MAPTAAHVTEEDRGADTLQMPGDGEEGMWPDHYTGGVWVRVEGGEAEGGKEQERQEEQGSQEDHP